MPDRCSCCVRILAEWEDRYYIRHAWRDGLRAEEQMLIATLCAACLIFGPDRRKIPAPPTTSEI